MKFIVLSTAAVASLAVASPVVAADTTVFNSAPAEGFHYGDGNDYTPANAAILTTDDGDELALRMHATYETAPASDASGVYTFALGTENLSFDWGIDTAASYFGVDALITVTNIGTGDSFNYDPLFIINDNSVQNGSRQNSYRVNWTFWGNANYDPFTDGTYRVDLDVSGLATPGDHSLTVFAQLGDGAMPAVPEPATWAMMLLGFFGVGGAMRGAKKKTATVSYA